ncbi:MAG: hypothetical protein M3019_05845 [Candidatus Dormibacteraeota bacterium]|nr:hypothetical protein [Candidatus Dormibacteraeota bacterium]
MTDVRPDRFDVASGPPGPSALAPPLPPPPPAALPERRRRSLPAAAAVAGALIAGVAVGVPLGLLTRGTHATPSSTATLAPSPPSAAVAQATALYQQALTAANGSAGFHYVAVSKGSNGSQTITGDAGQDGGNQLITMDSTYGPEKFTLLLVSGTVYFQGNGPALQDQLGVPGRDAPGLVDKWVSVSSGDAPYGVVAPGITVGDQVQEVGLTPSSIKQLGGGARRITGTVAAQQGVSGAAHLDLAAGSNLPVAYVAAVTDTGTTTSSTTKFSRWGTAPAVTTPSGAVAWSTLGAAQPPGGYGSGGHSASQTPAA